MNIKLRHAYKFFVVSGHYDAIYWLGLRLGLRRKRSMVRPNFFRSYKQYLKIKSHTIWDQSVKTFQNGGHFKSHCINLTRLGSKVKILKTFLQKCISFFLVENETWINWISHGFELFLSSGHSHYAPRLPPQKWWNK